MIHVITAVGILVCAGALVGVVAPSAVAGAASRVVSSRPLRAAVIAVRIVFGAICIIAANQTAYPLAMKIIGLAAIMAGTALAFIDKEAMNDWIERVKNGGAPARALFLAALGLGAFLVHASL